MIAPQRLSFASAAELQCDADQGLQAAQVLLARKYEIGQDVPQDITRAIALYERAAISVPPTTAIYSPPMTVGGRGQVLLLNNPDARVGSAEAQYRLGLLLRQRDGAHDADRARQFIQRAAQQGYGPAVAEISNHP